eukprot:UC4_evm1s204
MIFNLKSEKTSFEINIGGEISAAKVLHVTESVAEIEFTCRRKQRGNVLLRVYVSELSSEWGLIGQISPPPILYESSVRVSTAHNQIILLGKNFGKEFSVNLFLDRDGLLPANRLRALTNLVTSQKALVSLSGISESVYGPIYAVAVAHGVPSDFPVQIATIGSPLKERFFGFALSPLNSFSMTAHFRLNRQFVDGEQQLTLLYAVERYGIQTEIQDISLITPEGSSLCSMNYASTYDTLVEGQCLNIS